MDTSRAELIYFLQLASKLESGLGLGLGLGLRSGLGFGLRVGLNHFLNGLRNHLDKIVHHRISQSHEFLGEYLQWVS